MRTRSYKDFGETEKPDAAGLDTKLLRCVTRAKLVRRKTLALYSENEAAFCKRMSPQLFDRAINIKLQLGFEKLENKANFLAVIDNSKFFKECDRQSSNSVIDCADLFIPDFTRIKPIDDRSQWSGNEEFMLTLTDGLGKRSFAYCIKYLRQKSEENVDEATTSTEGFLPEVFAIISPIHAPPFYSALVRECINYIDKGTDTLKNFLDAVFHRPFPSKGSVLCLVENSGSVTKRQFVIRSQGPSFGRADSSFVIKRIGIEVSVSIIAALLSEQKVLIGGESVKSVSHAVQTFAALLQPFSWPYTLVPVLPDTLLELANSPTPCLLGVLRTNLHKLKELLVGTRKSESDDLLKNDVVIVDLDGGIFVPHPSELSVVTENPDFMEKSALALCERLLLPKKLAGTLISSFKEALAGGPGPKADEMLQKAMLVWFATLLGHYKTFNLPHAYLADIREDSSELRTALAQYILAHPSKTSRRFIEWFIETGLFRDWLRRKAAGQDGKSAENWEDAANQKFDELAQTLSVTYNQGRIANIFSRASSALFRSHLRKRF
ncbi:unnamed protein product [Enterobius vermicularis]|uniref:UDENN domain-containing protein n=1 Tax=Enterobius vermicularis TaxID=51028 RepID=A0A0N4USE6_ENTVE|nr:unnamed protein product [Enterobius vermicularis]